MEEIIRIIIVDDHPLFREGVAATLNNSPRLEVVGEGGNAQEAIELVREHLPDMVLLDVSMEGGGVYAVKEISKSCPVVKIAMLTVSEHADDIMGSLRNGATGYILKGVSGAELITIIEEIYRGSSYVSPSLAARLLIDIKGDDVSDVDRGNKIEQLTKREEQILSHLSKGLSNREIGEIIGISEKTVKHYVTNILKKLQVRNRVEAAVLSQGRITQN